MSLIWPPAPLAERPPAPDEADRVMPPIPPDDGFTLRFAGCETEVRPVLRQMRDTLARHGLNRDRLGTVELVLAEALNNIAEHAYAGQVPGPVILRASLRDGRLRIVLEDRGNPMPAGTPPPGILPDPNVPRSDLPEGGFGWFLIRDLTESAVYTRTGGENRLELDFGPVPDPNTST